MIFNELFFFLFRNELISKEAGLYIELGLIVFAILSYYSTNLASIYENVWYLLGYNTLLLTKRPESANTETFDKVAKYLIQTHLCKIKSVGYVEKHGENVLIIDAHKPMKIRVKPTDDSPIKSTVYFTVYNDASVQHIQICSRASYGMLKEYVLYIQRCLGSTTTFITVYQNISFDKKAAQNSNKCEQTEWTPSYALTNKTMENTVYSDEVRRELFDDVRTFMDAETYYNSLGKSYKRGYLLAGLPGTGKTSVAKILANMYNIPVFSFNLTPILRDPNQFNRLIVDINNIAIKSRHIVLLEDYDRLGIPSDVRSYDYFDIITKHTIMQFLDGITDCFGRLTFITVNDMKYFAPDDAMIRPGRIDKVINFGHCTPEQIRGIMRVYYGAVRMETFPADINLFTVKITPTQLIKLIETHSSAEQSFKYVCENLSKNDIPVVMDDATRKQRGQNRFGGMILRYPSIFHMLSDKVNTEGRVIRKAEHAHRKLDALAEKIAALKEKTDEQSASIRSRIRAQSKGARR